MEKEREVFRFIDYIVKKDKYQFILYKDKSTNHHLAKSKRTTIRIGYYHSFKSLLIGIRSSLIKDSIESQYDMDNLEFNIKEIDNKLKYLELPQWLSERK